MFPLFFERHGPTCSESAITSLQQHPVRTALWLIGDAAHARGSQKSFDVGVSKRPDAIGDEAAADDLAGASGEPAAVVVGELGAGGTSDDGIDASGAVEQIGVLAARRFEGEQFEF